MSAYYTNSLTMWRDDLLADQRRGVRRHDIMAASNHPDAPEQAKLLDLRTRIIGLIDAALAEQEVSA